jgi:hypothetical protein
MLVIGFLSGRSPAESAEEVKAFHRGAETGHVEGKNVAIEFHWADGRYDQLPALATELVARRVAVIAAVGGGASGLAAKSVTSTIPIVFASGSEVCEDRLETMASSICAQPLCHPRRHRIVIAIGSKNLEHFDGTSAIACDQTKRFQIVFAPRHRRVFRPWLVHCK